MSEKQANTSYQGSTSRQGNTKRRDSSSKIIFEDPTLCAQFLKGYLGIPMLKDVQPEDIEDVTNRYVHLFTEERNSDVVKRVHIRPDGLDRPQKKPADTPFYLVSLIEHKSNVDYNVVMQVFRYMVFIWEDYEKEMEKLQPKISKTKDFRYPPILPIVFYDGVDNWTAALRLHERVFMSDVLGEYIPDYRCILMQLNEYSNMELMEREDVLSVVMMMTNLHHVSDFAKIVSEVSPEYLQRVLEDAPEYLLKIVSQIVEALLSEINVPNGEIEKFTEQIKERHMGRLFANFEPYDVQAERKKLKEEMEAGRAEGRAEGRVEGRAEGRAEGEAIGTAKGKAEERENGIACLVKAIKVVGGNMEAAVQQLAAQYGLDEIEALSKTKLYW